MNTQRKNTHLIDTLRDMQMTAGMYYLFIHLLITNLINIDLDWIQSVYNY